MTATPGKVYVLQHCYELGGCDEIKFIGVFGSEKTAQEAVVALQPQPGFDRYPENFHIDAYELDRISWSDGFVTIERAQ